MKQDEWDELDEWRREMIWRTDFWHNGTRAGTHNFFQF